jgi:pantoate--beta-alanine ligase
VGERNQAPGGVSTASAAAYKTRVDIIEDPLEFQRRCEALRRSTSPDAKLAFVPTMGALHAGHLALVTHGKREGGRAVASIFVNPTQFGPNEDFARYPRDLRSDAEKFAAVGVELLFAPNPTTMYLTHDATRVRVSRLTEGLCGPFRPGHFEGVSTVVAKLLTLVGPCEIVMGKKDYQQLAVIRRMVADLFLPVHVEGVATLREEDGLAMSSRNRYLSPDDRIAAGAIPEALRAVHKMRSAFPNTTVASLRACAMTVLSSKISLQYLAFVDPDDLQPLSEDAPCPPKAVVALAGYVGKTRLIDNHAMDASCL